MAALYGIDPFSVPQWKADLLNRSAAALEAEAMLRLIDAFRIAQAKPSDYKRHVNRLRQIARPLGGGAPSKVQPATQQAREWFLKNDIPTH